MAGVPAQVGAVLCPWGSSSHAQACQDKSPVDGRVGRGQIFPSSNNLDRHMVCSFQILLEVNDRFSMGIFSYYLICM